MPSYVALLRGINVGGKKKLAMAELRELLALLGYRNVRTHLNSGNVVFSSADGDAREFAEAIERAVDTELGLSVRCLIRTGAELQTAIAANPLAEHAAEGSKLLVHFLSAAPEGELINAHDPRELDPESIFLGDRMIYQWCPDGVLKALPAGTFAEKHLGVTATARNWNTVTKLSALLDVPPSE